MRKFLQLLRIEEWRAFLLISLFGFLMAKGYLFPLEKIFLLYLTFFLFLGFGFLLNDCFDLKEDKFHLSKINLILEKKISRKKAMAICFFLCFFGLFLSLIFNKNFFLFSLFGVLTVIFYSVPPMRLKGKPFLDLISHGFYGGVFFFLAPFLALSQKIGNLEGILSVVIFYFSVLLELRNHVEDYFFDKQAGLKTTACFLGKENSEKILNFLTSLYPIFLLFPFLVIKKFIFLFLILSFLFLLFFLKFKNYKILDFYNIFSLFLVFLAKIT